MVIIGKGGLGREVQSYYNIHKRIVARLIENEEIDFYYKNPIYSQGAVIAIGDGYIRKRLSEKYNFIWEILNFSEKWTDILHAGEGTIICPGSYLTVNIHLGKHVLINLNCTVGHDTVIGDYTTLSPGANISGNVTIGKLCYIGSNAVIREKISICDEVTIGAGGVVVKDITEPGIYVGNPVKKLENNKQI